ncbi:hypothetical protein [Parapedobacter lycopersici]|uniref:hypothetical protein n=1 Tax=Parapedobacter lycopersici TaxID=1864939 RepID=UPI00214D7FB2|nr:hypothetical protein [Parapedobacter lycopersici]
MLFLKAKAWVIFFFLLLFPILGTIVVVTIGRVLEIPGIISIGTVIAWLPIIIVYAGWLWNAGIYLICEPNKMKWFRRLYWAIFIVGFLVGPLLNVLFKDHLPVLMEIIGLLNFIGLLYCINLIRKGLHQRENELGLTGSSRLIDFFLIWLLPVGIWFTQPRIQRALKLSAPDN